MRLLIDFLRDGTGGSSQANKNTFLQLLQEPGVAVPPDFIDELWQHTRSALGNPVDRLEGLALAKLLLDRTPDEVLSEHICLLMKQLIALSANDSSRLQCLELLHWLLLRLSGRLAHVIRDVNADVFPSLMQMLTRRLAADAPANPCLLGLTRVVVERFGKLCLPNLPQLQRFVFRQFVAAENQDLQGGVALIETIASFSKCHSDSSLRFQAQTSCLQMLIKSCLLTERALSDQPIEQADLQGTIYVEADMQLYPALEGDDIVLSTAGPARIKMILWKRLILQADAVEAVLASDVGKAVPDADLIVLIDALLTSGSTQEHLAFLRPTLISRALSVVNRMLACSGSSRAIRHIGEHLVMFLVRALQISWQTNPLDLTMLRGQVYESFVVLLERKHAPLCLINRHRTFLEVMSSAAQDVAAAFGSNNAGRIPNNGHSGGVRERCAAALAFQRAAVLAYGSRADNSVVREWLEQLIPATVSLAAELSDGGSAHWRLPGTHPFKDPRCRIRLYDLLTAFVVAPNALCLPPTSVIHDLLNREGRTDSAYKVRTACDYHELCVFNSMQPVECVASAAHARRVQEYHVEMRRIELSRVERTRHVATQTASLSSDFIAYKTKPKQIDKAVMVQNMAVSGTGTPAALVPIERMDDDDDVDEEEEEDDEEFDELSDTEEFDDQHTLRRDPARHGVQNKQRSGVPRQFVNAMQHQPKKDFFSQRIQSQESSYRPGPSSAKERALTGLSSERQLKAVRMDKSSSESNGSESDIGEDEEIDENMHEDQRSSTYRPGSTQNRVCASGLSAAPSAAVVIDDDDDEIVIAEDDGVNVHSRSQEMLLKVANRQSTTSAHHTAKGGRDCAVGGTLGNEIGRVRILQVESMAELICNDEHKEAVMAADTNDLQQHQDIEAPACNVIPNASLLKQQGESEDDNEPCVITENIASGGPNADVSYDSSLKSEISRHPSQEILTTCTNVGSVTESSTIRSEAYDSQEVKDNINKDTVDSHTTANGLQAAGVTHEGSVASLETVQVVALAHPEESLKNGDSLQDCSGSSENKLNGGSGDTLKRPNLDPRPSSPPPEKLRLVAVDCRNLDEDVGEEGDVEERIADSQERQSHSSVKLTCEGVADKQSDEDDSASSKTPVAAGGTT